MFLMYAVISHWGWKKLWQFILVLIFYTTKTCHFDKVMIKFLPINLGALLNSFCCSHHMLLHEKIDKACSWRSRRGLQMSLYVLDQEQIPPHFSLSINLVKVNLGSIFPSSNKSTSWSWLFACCPTYPILWQVPKIIKVIYFTCQWL